MREVTHQEIYDRFLEIVPSKKLDDLDDSEIKNATRIAWKIVGYLPQNLEKSIEKTWGFSDAISLVDFIYDAWEVDNELPKV